MGKGSTQPSRPDGGAAAFRATECTCALKEHRVVPALALQGSLGTVRIHVNHGAVERSRFIIIQLCHVVTPVPAIPGRKQIACALSWWKWVILRSSQTAPLFSTCAMSLSYPARNIVHDAN